MDYKEAKEILVKLYTSSEKIFKEGTENSSIPEALKKGIEACGICDLIESEISAQNEEPEEEE